MTDLPDALNTTTEITTALDSSAGAQLTDPHPQLHVKERSFLNTLRTYLTERRVYTNPIPGRVVVDPSSLGTSDDTAVIQAAIDSLATTPTGRKFQNSSGVYQGGGNALGGGEVIIPGLGLVVVSNLLLGHRIQLTLPKGLVLKQKNASTGALIANRWDTQVHAKYCAVKGGGQIDGNKQNQTQANVGILFRGDTTNTYNSVIDEDYDQNCVVDDIHVGNCKGDGVYLQGSGENRILNLKSERNDGYGVRAFQDNFFSVVTCSWNGLAGFWAEGDDNRLAVVKCWYNGQVDASSAGFKITADSGAMSACSAQDNWGPGFLWDGAYGWDCSALMSDSNSRSWAGMYPGFDIYNSGYNKISGTARNRYNSSSAAGQQAAAVRHRTNGGGNIGNLVSILRAGGVWGTTVGLQSGSSTTGSVVRVDDVQVTA